MKNLVLFLLSVAFLYAGTFVDITDKPFTNKNISCLEYKNTYISLVEGMQSNKEFIGRMSIEIKDTTCVFKTNNIPNHDFNDLTLPFKAQASEQELVYEITKTPEFATFITPLSIHTDNAIMLNGVKLDMIVPACYGVANEEHGCFDMSTPWRVNPISKNNKLDTGSNDALVQPNGAYHYLSAKSLYKGKKVSSVIGFAADGFAILSPYINEGKKLRLVKSSYQLKKGKRKAINGVNPGGNYDGTYRDDYEFVRGLGNLDECNGMSIDGKYAYYATESFPYVMPCFKGTPNRSFHKMSNRKRPAFLKRPSFVRK